MHDGDPYSSGLSGAFAAAFEALGGTVTAVAEVSKGETEMAPVLTGIAADGPEGIFFILFPEEAGHVVRQAGEVAGLEGAALITGRVADVYGAGRGGRVSDRVGVQF